MRPNQPRQICECGLSFRYPADFEEHKRVGCLVESGKGDSLAADPDEASDEGELTAAVEQELVAEVAAEQPKTRKKK